MKFSGGLMISAGEVFKAGKVSLVVFLLYRNWMQFRLRHKAKLMEKLQVKSDKKSNEKE